MPPQGAAGIGFLFRERFAGCQGKGSGLSPATGTRLWP